MIPNGSCAKCLPLNTGDKNSLWQLLDEEMESIESEIPMLKIWCAVHIHRSELAWKDAAGKHREVEKVLSVLSRVSTHFHYSALRSAELEEIAKEQFHTEANPENFHHTLDSIFSHPASKHPFFVGSSGNLLRDERERR